MKRYFFILLCLLISSNLAYSQDCLKLVYPNSELLGYFNPDSVMYDTCLCTTKPWDKPPCEYQFTKQWFSVILPYGALIIPKAKSDTIIIKKWKDIDIGFSLLREGFNQLELNLGDFILKKLYPEDNDSGSIGSRLFNIKFNNYVKIDTTVNYLLKLNGIQDAWYNWRYFINPDNVVEKHVYNTFNIYPNPCNDNLYLEFAIENKTSDIEIFSINGLKQFTLLSKINDDKILINLRDFNNGIYFLKYNNKTKLFVKIK